VRADINNNLAALYSLSSGSSEPSTTTAHQLWLDTSTSPDTLKIRNSSDSGWILIGDVSTNLGMALLTGATFSGNVLIAAGAVGSAGLGFSGDTDTGLYKVAANDLGITAGGSLIAHLNSSGLEIEDGKQLRLRDSGGSNIVSLAAPALTSDVALTLPNSDGNNGDFLQSNGSGVLSWAAVAGVPTGSVYAMATTTIPAGYLECNGASVSRTTYASLFTAIGTTWGSADGSSFNVPDLRGEFIRGFDNGKGTDSGRSFASAQGEAYKEHNHTASVSVSDPGHSHTVSAAKNLGGNTGGGSPPDQRVAESSFSTSSATTGISVSTTIANSGGTETRPRNISMMYIIKT
jgi:microcystin-dependent protein